jgi:hypothetical protein
MGTKRESICGLGLFARVASFLPSARGTNPWLQLIYFINLMGANSDILFNRVFICMSSSTTFVHTGWWWMGH